MQRLLPLLLATACVNGVHDPLATGLRIQPPPGEHAGPIDLRVINRTGDDLTCLSFETDLCPALPDVDLLAGLPAGERWEALEVTCTEVELVCHPADHDGTDLPLRTWRWFVHPSVDED